MANFDLPILIAQMHQFQLVTEHYSALKGATNYGKLNRATGVGTKQAVLRPRPRPGSSGLETKTETWTKWTRVHSSLETMVSRSQHRWPKLHFSLFDCDLTPDFWPLPIFETVSPIRSQSCFKIFGDLNNLHFNFCRDLRQFCTELFAKERFWLFEL